MRALVHAAVIQMLLAGAASADRQSVTFRGVQIDLDATQPLALTREADGIVVYARMMPPIWFGAYGEACQPDDRELELPRPPGFFVASGPPAVSPWPKQVSWSALCVEGDGVTLQVLVQHFDHARAPALNRHVREILESIVRALRPPIEIAPGVVYDRTRHHPLLKRGGRPDELQYQGHDLKISLDAASCRNLPALPAGTWQVCRELPDRALVVTYRGAPAPVGAPPPPEPAVASPPPADPAVTGGTGRRGAGGARSAGPGLIRGGHRGTGHRSGVARGAGPGLIREPTAGSRLGLVIVRFVRQADNVRPHSRCGPGSTSGSARSVGRK